MITLKKLLVEKNIHEAFRITTILKGIHAALEIIGGIVILFISQSFITSTVFSITQEELSEDPKDVIAHYLLTSAQQFSVTSQHFASFYLLSHGIIKIILVAGLLREKRWAYPVALVVFGLFILYQLFRFTFTHSLWLLVITLLDIVVIILTWHEYQYRKNHYIQ